MIRQRTYFGFPLRSLTPWALALAGALLQACDDGDDDPFEAVAESTSAETTEGDGEDLDELFACVESELAPSPVFGPGWDSATNTLLGEPQETYIVHSTQALVEAEHFELFNDLSDAVIGQLMQTPGLVAIGFADEPNCGFVRTMGIWESEAAMIAFVGSGAHAEAMAQSANLELAGRFTHFEATAAELPVDWQTIIERIGQVEPFRAE